MSSSAYLGCTTRKLGELFFSRQETNVLNMGTLEHPPAYSTLQTVTVCCDCAESSWAIIPGMSPSLCHLDRVTQCCHQIHNIVWMSTRPYYCVNANKILFPGCTNTPQSWLMPGNSHRINCPKDSSNSRSSRVCTGPQTAPRLVVSQCPCSSTWTGCSAKCLQLQRKDILTVTIYIFFYFFYN